MIPRPALTQWRRRVPWPTDLQVEQDLLLSILAIFVAEHPYLGERLVWRGGTCLHKLHLEGPRRYSEDLDYVLHDVEPDHGRVADALREVVGDVGMRVHHSEVSTSRVNVYADAEVLTFQAPELIGTKFRALAQRRKGRDLSDLWLARRELAIDDEALATAGHHYLDHEGLEPALLRQQLARHTTDRDFTHDLDLLTAEPYEGFDPVRQTHELIRWTDLHLDPLFDAQRSASARARRASDRRRHGIEPDDLQCTVHVVQGGGLGRCGEYFPPGARCPRHPPDSPIVVE